MWKKETSTGTLTHVNESYTIAEIAAWIGGEVRGDGTVRISGIAGVAEAKADQLTWLADENYAKELAASKAGAVIVAQGYAATPMPAILVEQPALSICTVLERFAPPVPRPAVGVHPTAIIEPGAELVGEVAVGPRVYIGAGTRVGAGSVLHAGVFVGAGTVIGQDCELWPNVVVRERCMLGDRVIVHPNTTIGADGFGYQFTGGRHRKIPQIGIVQIENDVEIGANCTIDRAKFGATLIGAGTKIDNLVQVAHNVTIGPACLIVAQCGIAGSTRLGTGVVLGGKVGVRDHVVLHDGVQASACCCISKNVPAGTRLMGSPALELEQWIRERSHVRRLARFFEQVEALAKRVEQLESTADH